MRHADPVDWRIELESVDSNVEDGGGTLEVLSHRADEEDAVAHLEVWAAVLGHLGYVPRTALEWLNESGVHVGRRVGRLRYRVRVDCFERETEIGTTVGAGWLLARATPRDPDDVESG